MFFRGFIERMISAKGCQNSIISRGLIFGYIKKYVNTWQTNSAFNYSCFIITLKRKLSQNLCLKANHIKIIKPIRFKMIACGSLHFSIFFIIYSCLWTND